MVFKVVWHPQHAVLVMGWLGRHSYGPSVETCPCKLKVTSNTECWVVCVLSRKVIGEQGFDPVSVAGECSTQASRTMMLLALGL